jgi:RimJ/RimL family protein N-acetyltransferase
VRSSILVNDTEICGKTIEVGYALHPDYHGRGLATEALGAVIPYLFAEGFDQVLAGAFETNTASTRVMEKSGMSRTKMTSEIEYRGKTHSVFIIRLKRIDNSP